MGNEELDIETIRDAVEKLLNDVTYCCGCTNYGAKESAKQVSELLEIDLDYVTSWKYARNPG